MENKKDSRTATTKCWFSYKVNTNYNNPYITHNIYLLLANFGNGLQARPAPKLTIPEFSLAQTLLFLTNKITGFNLMNGFFQTVYGGVAVSGSRFYLPTQFCLVCNVCSLFIFNNTNTFLRLIICTNIYFFLDILFLKCIVFVSYGTSSLIRF